MAKNYNFAEVVQIINAGTDLEAITDIGRRYPVLLNKVTKVAVLAGDDFAELMSFMPDHLTANKVNSAIKATIVESETDDEAEGYEDPKPMETASAPATDAKWDENMSAKQLWDILGKAGKRKLAKSTKKADLIEACKQAFGADAADEDAEVEADEVEATEANPYDGKSAMELFKECKKRGIKAPAKKPAKFYAELLVKADAETSEEAETEAADEWDEEEAPTEKPAKKAAKKDKAPAKKEKKVEDEDDDWDI